MGRLITIQYPDETIHNVEVYRFAKTKDDRYFIEYFDNTEHADMYTVLVKIDGKFTKDPNQTLTFADFTDKCTELELSNLPSHINCRTLLMNRTQTQTQTQGKFIVYIDNRHFYYINENLANSFNIPNRGGSIRVDRERYIRVYDNDIQAIEEQSNHSLKPEYRKYHTITAQTQALFIAYIDQNNNYYIVESLTDNFNIPNRGGSIIVDGIRYIRVYESDIHDIEERSNHTLKPEYRKYNTQDLAKKEKNNTKDPQTLTFTQSQFIVYIDQDNNYYVAEDLTKKYGIPNRGGSIIVDGIKYVKVYRTDVYDIVKKSNNTLIPIFKKYNLINPKKEEQKESSQYNNEPEERKIVTHQVMTYYYDINSSTHYLDREGYEIARRYEVEIEGTPKIIEGKNCYSITRVELNELVSKTRNEYTWMCKGVVTEKGKNNNNILSTFICKIGEDTFIPQDFYTKYKERTNQKRIKVDGTLYIQVSETELAEIKVTCAKNNIELVLVGKKVIPKEEYLKDMLKKPPKTDGDDPTQK